MTGPTSGVSKRTAVLWGVVPFEAFDQSSGFGGREGFVERRLAVDIEIVLDQNDGPGVGEMDIGQVFQDVSVVHGGMAFGDFDVAPALERRANHEEVGGPAFPWFTGCASNWWRKASRPC